MAPRFSIVIPTRNRGAQLDRCLAALGALEYARTEFEVLVVDDGSEPAVGEAAGRHAGSLALRCLRTEGVGPAAARNLGVRSAQGEYVAFTDDDCRPDAQWLRAFDAAIEGTAAERRAWMGLGGRIVDAPENGVCERASQMLVSFLYEYNRSWGELRFFCSNNLVFPRQALLAMGGFDESFPLAAAEDRYICARWLRQGELVYVPEAVVEHRQQLGLRGFVRQQFRYGRGAQQFWRRRRAEGGTGNRLEPGKFYGGLLRYPFGKVRWLEAVAASLLLATSQAAVALGYYWEGFRTRRKVAGPSGPAGQVQEVLGKQGR
jgi:glycosyltransferase involved in cell wall biosynthesis